MEKLTSYSATGIRKLIQKKKKAVEEQKGCDRFVLIIKPSAFSSFTNMVDECSISIVKKYYIDDVKPEDRDWLSFVSVTTRP